MKILKPSWLVHDGGIYSVDIHPTDAKVVTGGQNEGKGGLVVIWSLRPVLSSQLEADANVPKTLCRMEQYCCVNCVRWSPDGRLLACGGDDRAVTVWQYLGRRACHGTFGSDKPANVEQWKAVHVLKAHDGDVLHVEWSPTGRYLASCSVDNIVVVWNANNFTEKVAFLKGHTDMVKGVCWDPVGRYLASQSADRSVKIWATATWECVKTIKKPFEEASNTTHVLRLDWSPDGKKLLSAHAMNNGGPTAQLIDRQTWAADHDLVGHRKAVSCVRWNSRILQKQQGTRKTRRSPMVAVGSRDRALSVWQDCFRRPRLVVQQLFAQGILDLSWSGDGMTLAACSSDGTVALLIFSEAELGRPLSNKETAEYLKGLYGRLPSKLGLQSGVAAAEVDGAGGAFVDDPAVLKAQREYQQKQNIQTSPAPKPEELPPPPPPVPSTAQSVAVNPNQDSKQIETRTKDGKRRIQPLFLGSLAVPDSPRVSREPAPAEQDLVSASSSEKTNIQIERVEGLGKTTADLSAPRKRKGDFEDIAIKRKAPDLQPSKIRLNEATSPPLSVLDTEDKTGEDAPDATIRTPRNLSSYSLPLPPKRTSLSLNLAQVAHEKGEFNVLVENFESEGCGLARLRLMRGEAAEWETLVGGRMAVVAASNHLVAVGGFDATLSVFSCAFGRRLRVPLLLDSCVSLLSVSGWYLFAVTTSTACFVWNMKTGRSVIAKESLGPVLFGQGNCKIQAGSLTENGLPIVSLSNGRSVSYSLELESWVLLEERLDPLRRVSLCRPSVPVQRAFSPDGPLSNLTTDEDIGSRRTKFPPEIQTLATAAMYESRMEAAIALHSPAEYRFWLHQYVQRLTKEGSMQQLKGLLNDLLGPVYRSRSTEEATVVGLKKTDLLRELLPLLATNARLQRLYAEFQDALQSSSTSPL